MTEIIVGDVGGTSVRFALAKREDGVYRLCSFEKYSNDAFPDFYAALRRYLDETGARPTSALFALAGPPSGRTVSLTNRPWTVSADKLETQFGFGRADLVNDFTAMARCVPELPDTAFNQIKPGEPVPEDPVLVIGPGTGLGIATLLGSPTRGWHIVGGEGGHGAFSPSNDEEWEIFKIYHRELGYVPNELICAGIGLDRLHRAVCDVTGQVYDPMSAPDISKRALDGDPLCLKICRIRSRTVLSVAGDVALANGARGGVVIAGGASVRLARFLGEQSALDRFVQRGIQRAYMDQMPISLLIDETAPLIGAAALHDDFVSRI
ncbi:MAG: glucokinase [Pseudomonadota bacterium]